MYQTGKRWCANCEKSTHHWRELPDTPGHWLTYLEMLPVLIWRSWRSTWYCRGCKGLPPGTVAFAAKKSGR